MKSISFKIIALLALALPSTTVWVKSSQGEPSVYLRCGNESSPRRLVVLKDGSFGSVQIYLNGEKTPSIDAPASFSFSRCSQNDCVQSPNQIKTVGSTPGYSLNIPWRAMESGDRFHIVVSESTKGWLGETVVKKFNLTCRPGDRAQELVASTRSNK